MASSSSLLLAVVALAALCAVGSCADDNTFSFTIGKDSSPTKLSFVSDRAISEVSVREKDGEWSNDVKESPGNTFTFDSKEPIKGPVSLGFVAKGHAAATVVNIFPADYKAGQVYKTRLII